MRKEFISRLTKERFKSTKDLRNVFEAEKSAERRQARLHPSREVKGVYRGQFYRVKVPGPPPPSPVAKLLNPSSPPVKGFVHPEKSASSSSVAKHGGGGGSSSSSSSTTKKKSSTIYELRQATRAERQEFFNEYWDRVKKWWALNWPVLVLNFGSVCSLVGFTRSDVLELRCLSVTGSMSSVVYFLAQPARPMTPIIWSLTFASVNGYKIYQILVERKARVDLPKDQLEVYRRQFEPHSITQKQFEYIMEKAETICLKKGEVLIREGDPLRHVYLITKGHTRAHHLGRRLTAVSYAHDPTPNSTNNGEPYPAGGPPPSGGASGAWVGEMAFFERNWHQEDDNDRKESSEKNGKKKAKKPENQQDAKEVPRPIPSAERAMYTIVALEDDTTVLAWSHADMQALMERSGDMRAALTRAMTAAIVSKVVGFTMSRKNTSGGAAAWMGRLWQGATQGPVEPAVHGPPKVSALARKPVFSVPEAK